MNEEEHKEQMDIFNKQVQWLKDNIPPEDIYTFAQQSILSAMFFIGKWNEWVDVFKEAENDKNVDIWLTNISTVCELQEENIPTKLNVKMKEFGET